MDERNQENPQDDGLTDDERAFATFLKTSEEAKPEPEEEPEEEEQVEPPKEEAKAQPQAPPQGLVIDELPEEWRERVRLEIEARDKEARKFEAQWKAQAGQLSPIQRKLAETERALKQARVAQQQKPAGMSESKWERYKKEFTEESEALEELVNPLREQLKSATEQLAELAASKQLDDAVRELARVHPDWEKYEQDEEFDVWFEAARKEDMLIRENFPDGVPQSPERVAWLLTKFKEAQQMADLWQQSQGLPAPSAKAAAVVAKREQQKRDPGIGIKSGQSAPTRRNGPVDPDEEAFAAFLASNPPVS